MKERSKNVSGGNLNKLILFCGKRKEVVLLFAQEV